MDIQRYKLVEDGNGYTLEIYIGGFHEEFAQEFGHHLYQRDNLLTEAKRIAKEQYPNQDIQQAKIIADVLLISVLDLREQEDTKV